MPTMRYDEVRGAELLNPQAEVSRDKRVRSLMGSPVHGAYAKERPRCRGVIVREGYVPWREHDEGWWDGFSAQRPDGRRVFLSEGLKKQMRKMLWEGAWPKVGKLSRGDHVD